MEVEVYYSSPLLILLPIAFYVYFAVCVMVTANKLGTHNSWMAWVPILNVYLLIKMADRPGWWLVLMFVPFVNIAIAIYVWMLIAERRGRPSWWGILMIVPIVSLVIPAMLAFTEAGERHGHGGVAAPHA